ncbi:MAG: universal stress protein UspA, partial [Chloroflexi bacterium]|nr:universal stress protein UspA [Chloroflexota bacterium]
KPDLSRPFKLSANLRIWGRELPLSAIVGLLSTATIWTIILITQPFSRWGGIIWMIIGLIVFYFYRRRRQHLPTGHKTESEEGGGS